MTVHIRGKIDSLRKLELRRAAQFFTERLFNRQLRKHLTFSIRVRTSMKDYGECTVMDFNDQNKPRWFDIELKRGGRRIMLTTLAHEMVHAKQFAYLELDDNLTMWRGKAIDSDDVAYFDLPWEVEANCLEAILYNEYIEQYPHKY